MAAAAAQCNISPSTSRSHSIYRRSPIQLRLATVRCCVSLQTSSLTSTTTSPDPPPHFTSLSAFAPATVANLGPGFDFLGCAVDSLGDTVTAAIDPASPPGSLSISSITSDLPSSAKLSRDPHVNCAGIAALAVMRALRVRSVAISLTLHKGLPLGSGLGSSAASAAAAAVAVNELFGGPLSLSELVLAGLESEKKVSGYHADNVGPAIMGGFVLIRSYEPLELLRLNFPEGKELVFVLVSPDFEAPTKKMRAALPADVSMKDHVKNSSQAAALVAAVLQANVRLLGSAVSSDGIVEPRRAPLIPGMVGVKRAALEAGATGCTISGAGPTVLALTDCEEKGKYIGEKMVEAFLTEGGLKAKATVSRLDRVGARVIDKNAL
ncbi:homoserine kinase isoform X1 [Carex rostrata]